jgi:hypothetical protein
MAGRRPTKKSWRPRVVLCGVCLLSLTKKIWICHCLTVARVVNNHHDLYDLWQEDTKYREVLIEMAIGDDKDRADVHDPEIGWCVALLTYYSYAVLILVRSEHLLEVGRLYLTCK